jgi:hypothetical protein
MDMTGRVNQGIIVRQIALSVWLQLNTESKPPILMMEQTFTQSITVIAGAS